MFAQPCDPTSYALVFSHLDGKLETPSPQAVTDQVRDARPLGSSRLPRLRSV
jgi:hypothetical protein